VARSITAEQKAMILDLYQTYSIRGVARRVGLGYGTVHGVLVDEGIPRRPRGKPGHRRAYAISGDVVVTLNPLPT
jgi:transposase